MKLTFYREKYVVKLSCLVTFLFWVLQPVKGFVPKLRKLASLFLFVKPGVKINRELVRNDFSWLRYATDGNRMQFFDLDAKRVIKVDLKINKVQMQKEIEARKLMGDNSPIVINYQEDQGILTEQWMKLKPTPVDLSLAHDAFKILSEKFHVVRMVAVAEYLPQFSFVNNISALQKFVKANGIEFLNISRIHGDIWAGNLCYNESGKLILLDWEYTSEAIVSHDVWTYLFQMYNSQKLSFDDVYFKAFSNSLTMVYGKEIEVNQAKTYHLLHLLERYRLYLSLEMKEKKDELEFFKRQINQIIQIL
ncbi:MAG: hypothetical protein NT150_15250 [Bacteroidetes bacterium]|nr:hypothetical protein [Bacteroidota bacterium]